MYVCMCALMCVPCLRVPCKNSDCIYIPMCTCIHTCAYMNIICSYVTAILIYINTYIHTYMDKRMHATVCIAAMCIPRLYVHMCVCTYICISMCGMYTLHMYKYTYIHVYTVFKHLMKMSVCMYVFMYAFLYVCICLIL
jgi:hypothetical protein